MAPTTVRHAAIITATGSSFIDCGAGAPASKDLVAFGAIAGLRGDEGARRLLERFAEVRRNVPVDDAGIVRDVDEPRDLGADGSGE